MKRHGKKGFTLLELLIVVAIIGLIATMASYAFGDFRRRSRDTKRSNDLSQIRKAMELAFNQSNGYPVALTPIVIGDDAHKVLCGKGAVIGFYPDTGSTYCDADRIYIGLIPPDPSPMQAYMYQGTETSYCIQTTLEVGTESLAAGPIAADQDSLRSGTCP